VSKKCLKRSKMMVVSTTSCILMACTNFVGNAQNNETLVKQDKPISIEKMLALMEIFEREMSGQVHKVLFPALFLV
jgi:hypothetical protein